MAFYTNKEIAFGDRDLSNQRTGSFTYSTTDINNAINSAGIPSTCKATKIITTVRMGKSYQLFDSKMNLTMSISSYSKTFTDVISNVLGNNDIKDGDLLCTSDNILSYTGTSNGRFNNNLNFVSEKASATCYWKCRVRIYIDYETPETLTVTSSDTNKGTVSGGGTYYSGTTVTLTASPKTGYNVNYWTKNGTKISGSEGKTSISAVTEATSATYQAVFQGNSYTITFNANGGTLPSDLSTLSPTYNSQNYYILSNLSNTTRKCYTLKGFYDAKSGGNKIYDASGKYVSGTYWDSNGHWKYTGNVTAYAQWTEHRFTLNYYANNGETSPFVTWNAKPSQSWPDNHYDYTKPEKPDTYKTRVGYTGTGNYGTTKTNEFGAVGGKVFNQDYDFQNYEDLCNKYGKNITTQVIEIPIYAEWTPNTYYIKYDGNGSTGGSIGNSTHRYDDSTKVSDNSNGYERIYKISYNANYGNCDIKTANAIYELDKWTTKKDGTGISRAPGAAANNLTTSGTITLYAQWKGGTITLPTPERAAQGYIFAGWYDSLYDGNFVGAAGATITPTKDMILYAHWTAISDIGYDNLFSLSNWVNSSSGRLGGAANSSDSMVIDNVNGTIQIKEGDSSGVDVYTNYGNGNGHYNIPIASTDSEGNPIKYYIKMHMKQNITGSLGQFFVFYYTETGNASTSHEGWRSTTLNSTGDFTFEFTPPSNCTKIGLRFGTYSNLADIIFSNIRIYKETNTYKKITSTISNYKSRDLKTLNSLYSPSKEGHTFNGWYQNESLSTKADLSWAQSITEGKTIYSKWTEHKYTINFNGGLGNVTGTTASISNIPYQTQIKLTKNNFQRVGYKFLGWSTDPEHTNPQWTDQQTVQGLAGSIKDGDNITLYAIWEQLEYTIKWKNLDGKGGSKLQEKVGGGTFPKCPYDIVKEHDEIYHYHFNNKWTPSLQVIGGDPNTIIEYEAVFDAEEHKYHLITVEPKEKNFGYDLHTCTINSVCGYSYRDNPKWGITFLNGDGSELEYLKLSPGEKPTCSKTPIKEPTIDSTFVLNKLDPWSPKIKITPEVNIYSDEPIENGNMIYTPNFFRMDRYYTVTFLDEEEKIILSQKKIKYGEKIYAPEPPDEDDDEFDTTFFGWLEIREDEKQIFWSENSTVEKDVKYKAVYTRDTKSYNVEWWRSEEDPEPICVTQVLYGHRPNFPFDIYGDPVHPLQGKDPKYNYIFFGWTNASDLDPEDQWQDNQNDLNDLPEITWHTKYVAVFGTEDIKYKVRWLNPKKNSNTEYELIYEEEINYGIKPVFDITKSEKFTELAHPMQGEDKVFNYNFIGWKTSINEPPMTDDELEFQGEITYMAVYFKRYIEYVVQIYRFSGDDYPRDKDGKIKPEEYIRHYGDKLYPNAMLNDIIGHTFSHWSNKQTGGEELTKNEILSIEVKGNNEYWAIYDKKEFQVRWLNYNRVQIGEQKTFLYKDKPLETNLQEPIRDWDDLYHYTFRGWLVWSGRTTDSGEILSDIDYIASYDNHEHIWGATEYFFSEYGDKCAATRQCIFEHKGKIEQHLQDKTVKTTSIILNGDDATCTDMGHTTYVANFRDSWNMTNPQQSIRIKDIPAKGHDYAPAQSLGKNIEKGEHYIYCRRCDYSKIKPHNWQLIEDAEISSPAACLIGGKRKYRCQTFGCEGYYYEYIEPNGHNFTEDRKVKEVKSTCTKSGNRAYKQCSDCLLFFSESAGDKAYGEKTNKNFLTSPLGHSYILDEKKPIKKADCETAGTEYRTCSRTCGEEGADIEIIIPPRGHDWAWQSTTTPATCTQEGKEIYYCQNTRSDRVTELYKQCEEEPKEAIVPKTPHQPVTIYGYKPTCTKDGLSDGTKCRICDTELTLQYTLPALGHKYVAKNVVPAENTLRREIIYGCIRKDCNHNYHIEYIK